MRSRDVLGLSFTVIVGMLASGALAAAGAPLWVCGGVAFAIGWFGSVASRNLGSGS